MQRAAAVLDCFLHGQADLSLPEICAATSLSKSTAFNLLRTLQDAGYVRIDQLSKRYSLGIKAIQLGGSFLASLEVRPAATQHVSRLRDITGETIGIYIRNGHQRVCIDRVWSPQRIRQVPELGVPVDLWIGAAGTVFMGGMDSVELDQYLAELIQSGELNSTDVDNIRARISVYHEEHYSLSSEKRADGSCSVAVPVFDYASRTVAAIVITGPITRWNQGTIQHHLPAILECGAQVSASMGWSDRRHATQRKQSVSSTRLDSSSGS